MSAPALSAEVRHFMDTFAEALMRGSVRPINDLGGSAGLHGSEPMERHIEWMRKKERACVETLDLPNGALVGLVTRMTPKVRADLIAELARLRNELRNSVTKGTN